MEHGTRNRYVGGCRCRPCKVANATYQRERYQARADVRAAKIALHLAKERASGILPRAPAMDAVERARRDAARDRAARAAETSDERSARLAARSARLASVLEPERNRRLALQRERNARYRERKRSVASDSQVACVQEFTIAPDYSTNTTDSTV
jgi:hypothetical protein